MREILETERKRKTKKQKVLKTDWFSALKS